MNAKNLKIGSRHPVFGFTPDGAQNEEAGRIGFGPGWTKVGTAHIGKGGIFMLYLDAAVPSGTLAIATKGDR